MFNVTIYTDGACSGNPGVGGYGAIISYNGVEKIIRGYESDATNNRMELMAVVEAIKALKKPCEVSVYTDSKYLCTCAAHKADWLTSSARPNRDLWMELISAKVNGKHKIKFVKVAGHTGLAMNERCDKIAKEQVVKCKREMCN